MKIVVDENITYAHELFNRFGKVKIIPGHQISAGNLEDADTLIIRSVTQVNEKLLSGKKIQFVGSATSGTDHIDKKWLVETGISFSAAPGCNAIAVVEYVFSSLLMLGERDNFSLKDRTIGIVGVGNIGECLRERLEALDIHALLCDPPRADQEKKGNYYSLNQLIIECDIISFHVPLLKEGKYKTLHLMDENLIRCLKPGTILINTCRGSVVDNIALLKCLEEGQELTTVLDVWESEPNLNIALLKKVDVATAHIAGYTLEGRARATGQVFEAYSRFLGKPQKAMLDMLFPKPKFRHIMLHGSLDQTILKKLVHLMYDVRYDDALLRKAAGTPWEFDKLRKYYFDRREWSTLRVTCDTKNTSSLLKKLGFNAVYCPDY